MIEEFLDGEEVSFMVLSDGEHVLPLGAYSPAPVVTPEVHEQVLREILMPLLDGLQQKNIRYRGLLYVGLMITNTGPKVIRI